MNHIELFAGCGGLSLGLKSLGAHLLLANELSPMASETFAYNFFNEDLRTYRHNETTQPLRTKWLSSAHPLSQLSGRLRENPQLYPALNQGSCDLSASGEQLEGSLVVGSIVQLNEWLTAPQNRIALERLRSGFGRGGVDLVSGGPPCQSFSMAGMREYGNSRNVLPWEFAKFVELVQPKFVLLENVSGILHPFQVEKKKVFAWFEVAQAFAQIGRLAPTSNDQGSEGYVPLCLHLNAKNVGVAQNRPRFVMIGFRHDVLQKLLPRLKRRDLRILKSSQAFFTKVRAGLPVDLTDLLVHDSDKDPTIFTRTFLSGLVQNSPSPTVEEAIHDLHVPTAGKSRYVKRLNGILGSGLPPTGMHNHEERNHGLLVKRRFRIYQVLSYVSSETNVEVTKVLNRQSTKLSSAAWQELRSQYFYIYEGMGFKRFKTKAELLEFLIEHQTAKHSQKALVKDEPAPAALSIPDDACHYVPVPEGLRTLTVREMARIQSFPDDFVFRSKATTGGDERKFEVPQYTQVGNAVPPMLGRALGKVVEKLLRLIERPTPTKLNGARRARKKRQVQSA